jgi:6-phosphogluconolactonase
MGAPVVSGLDRQLRVFPTLASATAALARHIAAVARESVRVHGAFSIVLSGGRTPEGLYRLLARRYRNRLPWSATEVYFGDERCVPPWNPESNYAMARDALLAHIPIPGSHIHRLPGEVRPPAAAAARYARQIGPLEPPQNPGTPRFDLVLLGIGPDGHTASLFPGTSALRERRRSVVSVLRAGQPPNVPRLTLTVPALSSSREVCFLVAGKEKAGVVAAVLGAPPEGDPRFPASLVRGREATVWYMDQPAASELRAEVSGP